MLGAVGRARLRFVLLAIGPAPMVKGFILLIRNPKSTIRNGIRGSALVELVIVLPFFILLLAGVMKFGQWYLMKNRMVMVSQYAMGLKRSGLDPTTIRAAVQEELRGSMWRSMKMKIEGVPLAAFFPSTSQQVEWEVESPAVHTRGISVWREPMRDRYLVTTDAWHYGVPHE